MDITITGRHSSVESAVQEYARQRLEKILRLHERLGAAHLVFDHVNELHTVEANINAPQRTFAARTEGKDLRAVIDALGQKLEAQIRQWKERLIDRRSRA